MKKTAQPRRTCGCGEPLVWHRRAAAWYCPVLDDEAPAIAGILKPSGDAHLRHVTCYPGELVDDSQEPTLRELAVRGVNTVEQVKQNQAIGGKPVVVSRNHRLMFNCSDCGYRTESTQAMMNHLISRGHNRAENLEGEVLNPGGKPRRSSVPF